MRFNEEIAKSEKRVLGRTDVTDTPLEIHGRKKLTRQMKEQVRAHLEKALGHHATFVERAEVWFDDDNGPRGGVDTVCRVTLVLGHLPNLFMEERAADPVEAMNHMVSRLSRALTKTISRHGLHTPKAKSASADSVAAAQDARLQDLVGQRMTTGRLTIDAALKRPHR